MNSLPELIENANLRMGENRAFLETADKTALIALDYKEQEKKWITTASDNYQSPPLQPNRTESGLNTSPSSVSEASGDLKNSTTKAQKNVFQKLNPNQLQAQKLEAQAKEARERQNARAIADKRAQILRDKEQAEGKSVLEATMLTKQDDIPYTPLKETSIALDNTQPFNAHYAIININDIKPKFDFRGTQGRTSIQQNVIDNIKSNLRPELLLNQEGGFNGLPLILSDGQVLVGNHRAKALSEILSEPNNSLKSQLEQKFGVKLKDDEMIVRRLDDNQDLDRAKALAYQSNVGRESSIGEKSLALVAKYKDDFAKLPEFIDAKSPEEAKNIIAKTLSPENAGLNRDETALALLTHLSKSNSHSNIIEALDSIKGSAQDKSILVNMFVDNVGGFYNIAKDPTLKNINLNNYLLGAIISTSKKSLSRADDYNDIIARIKNFDDLTKEGKDTSMALNPSFFDDLKSQILGAGLSKFLRQENPSTALFDFLKNAKSDLQEMLSPSLFDSNGKPLSEADMEDFLALLISQGQKSREQSELISLLPKLKELEDNYKPKPNTHSLSLPRDSEEALPTKTTLEKNLTSDELLAKINKIDLNSTQNTKILVAKVRDDELENLAKEFNFKGNYQLAREIDSQHIAHTLRNHGDEAKEAQRGQIAITKEDIANYENIIKSADIREINGKNIIYKKQINGHYVVVEEALTGKNKLEFVTMWKSRGNITTAPTPSSKGYDLDRTLSGSYDNADSTTNKIFNQGDIKFDSLEDFTHFAKLSGFENIPQEKLQSAHKYILENLHKLEC
ncbi:tetrahydrofolate dehydrogenase/cyclohydrolase, NAD(P)-binding domain protein [Helicobacter fennelliae]|uniref:Tetrahydrofolate dehydrogenase/cyclohydrolase, NAD(P)-binding domain protein n=1 Tax=Helicobacter fennelliae TaxID=215 RepID=A0A2X3B710_9HELI|nr:hypothetical protein [Helicobacter fennelliae]SQB99532.1 tetrahydrofolate dehydrogenase/cyclohydrolase, NAD(P)-binding domain protein [Helicobacter fennelliae]